MLVRFCQLRPDPHSHSPQGVFQAAIELRDPGRLEPCEEDWLERDLDWLRAHLPSPPCLRHEGNDPAIHWFKPTARRAIDRVSDAEPRWSSRRHSQRSASRPVLGKS
jgi:hypothetical protein